MKIAFVSSQVASPSFQFYRNSLSGLNNYEGVSLDVSEDPKKFSYEGYDVILFMGFDPQTVKARQASPKAKIGIVDPRSAQKNKFKETDFIVSNSLEARDYFSKYSSRFFLYLVYPTAPEKAHCPVDKKSLILGYHGNKIHLNAMMPRISNAIAAVHREMPIEFWVMYNIKKLGRCKSLDRLPFPVCHIQFSYDNYARYIAHADIGLVPQFIPVQRRRLCSYLMATLGRRYNENFEDFMCRYKETTNTGRHHVFAQYKIPVVSDMTPSASFLLGDDRGGYVANSEKGWENALRSLIKTKEHRIKMGEALYQKWQKYYAHNKQNERLITFLGNI